MSSLFVVGCSSDISTKRQLRAKKFKAGDKIRIARDPDNKYDKYAVEVTTLRTDKKKPRRIGFIPKSFAKLITDVLKKKKKMSLIVKVSEVIVNKSGDTVLKIKVPSLL